MECKTHPHQPLHGPSKRASFTISNIMSNPRSLNASRNNSFCTRSAINHGAHARKIAQILLSPTGSSFPSNECSTYMKHDASYDMVCVVQFALDVEFSSYQFCYVISLKFCSYILIYFWIIL